MSSPTDPSGVPNLLTERLLLRAFCDADRDAFIAMHTDDRFMEFLFGSHDAASASALMDRFAHNHEEDGHGFWAVQWRSEPVPGRLLGAVGLVPGGAPVIEDKIELAWRVSPEHWGVGIATEAARAAARFGFVDLGQSELVAITVPANVGSRAVMARLGMTRDQAGAFDHPRIPVGHPLSRHVLYRLDRTAWETSLPDTVSEHSGRTTG